MQNKFFWLIILLFTTASFAANIPIYKWVDKNNIVHFSQAYPTNENYTEITIKVAYQPSVHVINSISGDIEKPVGITQQQAKITAENIAKIEKNCLAAQTNNKILSGINKVLLTDDKGKEKVLTVEERAEQLALSIKHIEIYCDTTSG